MHKKILGLIIVGVAAIAGNASALNFTFPAFGAADPIQEKFADVNYFAAGNNFAGSFFWLPTVQVLPSISVTLGSDTRYCTKKLRGLYYNNAWGNRLWPIDQQTLTGLISLDASYADMTIAGGFYTSCTNPSNTGNLEIYSVYGQLKYTWKGQSFSISLGRRYDVPTNATFSSGPLVSSVQYFNNQTPLGYVYDNIAGIGFIGGVLPVNAHDAIINQLNSGSHVNEIFSFDTGSTSTLIAHTTIGDFTLTGALDAGIDTLWRIAVLGNVLLSKGGLNEDDRRSILGNPNKGSSIVVSDNMNISNSINQLKRNASTICRGKKVYDYSTWMGGGGSTPTSTVCVGVSSDDFSEIDPVVIDLANTSSYTNKTIVVYGKNVVLSGSMPQDDTLSLNLFVDRGNVLLSNPTAEVYFDKDGNLGDGSSVCLTTGCTLATYLRGNILINGLFFGDNGDPITHKVFIHGKFASLNSGLEPTTERKNQIQTLLDSAYSTYGTDISSTYCGGNNCINFNNVLTWECELSGIGSDGSICNISGDRFKYNPFVIIDSNIPTALFQ